jgi:hypothetical protein
MRLLGIGFLDYLLELSGGIVPYMVTNEVQAFEPISRLYAF